jgi:hypothetical protein
MDVIYVTELIGVARKNLYSINSYEFASNFRLICRLQVLLRPHDDIFNITLRGLITKTDILIVLSSPPYIYVVLRPSSPHNCNSCTHFRDQRLVVEMTSSALCRRGSPLGYDFLVALIFLSDRSSWNMHLSGDLN